MKLSFILLLPLFFSILAISFSMSSPVLKFGSLSHKLPLCPTPLQHSHFFFSKRYFSPNSLSLSSSSSSLQKCLANLQPGASFFVLPQHHHICPLNWYLWVLQDQLKFSDSRNSLPQVLQVFWFRSTFFLFLSLWIFCRSLSLSFKSWELSFSNFCTSSFNFSFCVDLSLISASRFAYLSFISAKSLTFSSIILFF